jgi:hypothetical protein
MHPTGSASRVRQKDGAENAPYWIGVPGAAEGWCRECTLRLLQPDQVFPAEERCRECTLRLDRRPGYGRRMVQRMHPTATSAGSGVPGRRMVQRMHPTATRQDALPRQAFNRLKPGLQDSTYPDLNMKSGHALDWSPGFSRIRCSRQKDGAENAPYGWSGVPGTAEERCIECTLRLQDSTYPDEMFNYFVSSRYTDYRLRTYGLSCSNSTVTV